MADWFDIPTSAYFFPPGFGNPHNVVLGTVDHRQSPGTPALPYAELAPYTGPDPFPKLPIEIFLKILSYIIDPPQTHTLRQHQLLSRVAKSWRVAIMETPSFWCYIISTGWIYKQLKYSQSSPLYVSLTLPFMDDDSYKDPSVKKLIPHSSRWRTVKLPGLSLATLRLIEPGLRHNTSLKHLELAIDGPTTQYMSVNGETPREPDTVSINVSESTSLEILILSRILPSPKLPSSLRTLKIHKVTTPSTSVSVAAMLLEMLRHCPDLRQLSISEFAAGPNSDTAKRPAYPNVTLGWLESFSLKGMPPHTVLLLLRRLSMPSLHSFSLEWPYRYRSQDSLEIQQFLEEGHLLNLAATVFQNRPWQTVGMKLMDDRIQVLLDGSTAFAFPGQTSSATTQLLDVFRMGERPTSVEFLLDVGSITVLPSHLKTLLTLPIEAINITSLHVMAKLPTDVELLCNFLRDDAVCPKLLQLSIHMTASSSTANVKPGVQRLLQTRASLLVRLGSELIKEAEVFNRGTDRWESKDLHLKWDERFDAALGPRSRVRQYLGMSFIF